MGEKRIGDGSFADAFVVPGAGSNKRLDRIEGLFDWSRFERLLKPVRSSLGRKGHTSSERNAPNLERYSEAFSQRMELCPP